MTFKGKIPWNKGKHWPEEIKRKISESMKGEPKPWNSYPRSETTKRKLRNNLKGKPSKLRGSHLSQEHRMKIGEALKGHIPWNKGKKGVQAGWNKGKPWPEEIRRKIGLGNKGKISEKRGKTGIYSVETIRKMSEAANRRWSKESERKKQSIAKLGSIPWMKGRHHTEESKRKMSETKRAKRLQKNDKI